MLNIAVVGKVSKNKHFRNLLAGGKHDPASLTWGGGPRVAAPVMAALGLRVELFSRNSEIDSDELVRLFNAADVRYRPQTVQAPTGINVVLDDESVLRVVPAPPMEPTELEAKYLASETIQAVALVGSLPNSYVAFWIEAAAARGVPVFWNPSASADLNLSSIGAEVILQVSFAEFSKLYGVMDPEQMASTMLKESRARAVVVTNAAGTAVGIENSARDVIRKPAIPLPMVVARLGAGDSHFGGFVAAWMNAMVPARLERAMAAGRVTGARHVFGLPPAGWGELRSFETGISVGGLPRVA